MKELTFYLAILLIVNFPSPIVGKAQNKIVYPIPRRDKTIVDNYHETKIKDPYRWLENADSNETQKYVKSLNNVTQTFIKANTNNEEIKKKLSEMWNYHKQGSPFRGGQRYFNFENTGLQNHNVLYVRDSLEDKPRIFLDPNTWSKDGTVAFGEPYAFSENGELFAYSVSSSGSDWKTIKFMTVADQKQLPDELKQVKFSHLAWTHDNKGVFYSMYSRKDGNGKEITSNTSHVLMYHKLGQPQKSDILIYQEPKYPNHFITAKVTDCGRYLLVFVNEGSSSNVKLLLFDLKNSKKPKINKNLVFQTISDKFKASFSYITNYENKFLFTTDLNAPMNKIIEININKLNQSNWKDVVKTNDRMLLKWANVVNQNYLVVCHSEDVKDVLSVFSVKCGKKIGKIPLDLGTVTKFNSRKNDKMAFFSFNSYLTPATIYSCDFSTVPFQPKVLSETKLTNFQRNDYELKQVFYPSKTNGTNISMFIMKHKDLVLNGKNPCILYGYGGFGKAITPKFDLNTIFWLKYFRGVYAVANIRGGGEYGKAWHDGGRLQNKQNSFDDFQSAAEYLVRNKYTNSKKLTIVGGSNGGLLVAASMLQHPNLYGAVVGRVGVYDMLRFHKFTVGHAWVTDYGNPDNPEHFKWIIKYSPLHNVRKPKNKKGQYPALLLLTGDHDDRVVPAHSLKFIAQLHFTCKGSKYQKNPLLLRVDVNSGHGKGKSTSKVIEEWRDTFGFLQLTLGLKWYN